MTTRRLLTVDDELQIGFIIRRIAEGCGFDVRVTGRADEFKAEYESARPDVVALDLDLPDGDGIELLRFLADAGSDAQVLIVSGFDGKVLESAKRLGHARGLKMAGVIAKPMRLADLRSILGEMRRAA